jgi:CheY-like chemotaxis protein
MESDPPSLVGMSILIVDDHRDSVELIDRFLSTLGADVRSASTADTALELFLTCHPTAVVTELWLHGVSSFALARWISRRPGAQVRLVAASSYAHLRDRERAFLAGFHAFLPKPIDLDDLRDALGGAAAVRAAWPVLAAQ